MDNNNDLILNLAAWSKEGTEVLGPGKRLAIWTQGCLKKCPGCISPEFQPLKLAQKVDGKALATYICTKKGFTGITISGGEPFLQAANLAKLIHLIREENNEFTVIVFTGFYHRELNWKEAEDLLKVTDLLIDGPYLQEQICNKGLRGSTNQQFHFLTNRLIPFYEEIVNGKRKREIQYQGSAVFPIGIPSHLEVFGDLFENLSI
ncbi:MAG: radical SAM protein [Parabacteroides sp.]|nr:radical SAM protein [Parabacteroides sp.]